MIIAAPDGKTRRKQGSRLGGTEWTDALAQDCCG